MRPIPPSPAGRLSRSRTSSEKGGLPVIAGMKVWWISFRSVCVCVCEFVCVRMCVCMSVYVSVRVCAYVCVCVLTHSHTHTHTRTQSCARTRSHTHTIRVCVCVTSPTYRPARGSCRGFESRTHAGGLR